MISIPPRRLVLVGIILAFLLFLKFGNVHQEQSVSGLSNKALNSLCNSARMQSMFPGPKRLSDKDFDKEGMYSAGSRDTWVDDENDGKVHWSGEDEDTQWEYAKSARMLNVEKLLKGNATMHFRDNLRDEYQYITGWGDGGFTNQFMGITNLLFLSLLTPHRIPIIPPFVARPHLPIRAGYLAASEVFDLDRWGRSINKELVEWQDVKDIRGLAGKRAPDSSAQADEMDELGCWSVWATSNLEDPKPYTNAFAPDNLNLDISHTAVPREARLFPFTELGETHTSFNQLAILSHATPSDPNPLSSSPLGPIFPSARTQSRHPPDPHLMCYDFLYRVSSTTPWEWNKEFSSAWNIVGKHAHWSDRIRSLVRQTLARTLEVIPKEILPPLSGDLDFREDRDGRTYHPHDIAALAERDRVRTPYIAVHARHGDFLRTCKSADKRSDSEGEAGKGCAPRLSTFERQIEEVEEELHRRGVGVKAGFKIKFPVIVTSDETDEEWWAEVARYGWKRVRFPTAFEGVEISPKGGKSKGSGRVVNPVIEAEPEGGWPAGTYEKLWDMMLIEVAIQGMAVGFVGTPESTMSLVAKRRVEHWQGGVTRMVDFGFDY